MPEATKRRVWSVAAGMLVLGLMCTAFMTASVTAQDTYDTCVDNSDLESFDKNRDGVLSMAELRAASAMAPGDTQLQALVTKSETESSVGIRYDGQCGAVGGKGGNAVGGAGGNASSGAGGNAVGGRGGDAVAGSGGKAVSGAGGNAVSGPGGKAVAGKPGESVVGKPGESVVGKPGESVVGKPGESVSIVSGQSSDSEVCQPNRLLGLVDSNDDGVVTIEEIDEFIEDLGGNAELETARDEAVAAGITGIRYRDCDPGTPAATPVSATPAATPNATPGVGTPAAWLSELINTIK